MRLNVDLNIQLKGDKLVINLAGHIHEKLKSVNELYEYLVGPNSIDWTVPQTPPQVAVITFGEQLFWILYKDGKFGHFGHFR